MNNNWEPRIGQKVVALETSAGNCDIKKGDVLTVGSVGRCSCGKIMVGIVEAVGVCNITRHIDHKFHHPGSTLYHDESKFFAPVSEQYADMTSEIAQQFKEHPDTVDQPVKILETVN